LVIVGTDDDQVASQMMKAALRAAVPRRTVRRLCPGGPGEVLPPPVRAMLDTTASARAYACRGTHCLPPAETVERWEETLAHLAEIPET
jgi:uncharacterized protein YyaL (SSP411 family)